MGLENTGGYLGGYSWVGSRALHTIGMVAYCQESIHRWEIEWICQLVVSMRGNINKSWLRNWFQFQDIQRRGCSWFQRRLHPNPSQRSASLTSPRLSTFACKGDNTRASFLVGSIVGVILLLSQRHCLNRMMVGTTQDWEVRQESIE